ncbi:MAG: hypothetical protein ACRETB_14035 [Steroidobacteraceae bacterium]
MMTRTASLVLSSIAALGLTATFSVAAQARTPAAPDDGSGTILSRVVVADDGSGTILSRVVVADDGSGTILSR